MNDAPFLVALVMTSVVAVAVALLVQRMVRDAAARHSIVLAALLLPPVLLVATAAGLPSTVSVGGIDMLALASIDAAKVEQSRLPEILAVIWIAGAAIALARIVMEALRWRGIAARAEVGDNVARSSEVREPTVIGVLRPIIVLPANYDLEPAELDAVLAHEHAHIARRDNLTALAVQLVCAAFWFDPLHRVARRALIELRERACDDAVLDRGCDAAAYVAALARSCETSFHTPAVACMSRLSLNERMESIMTHETRHRLPPWIRRTVITAAVAAAAIAFGTFAPTTTLTAGEATSQKNATRPKPIHHVNAVYTEEAKANRVEGDCVVEVTVDKTGVVTDTRVVKPLPHGLDQAAVDALRQWKFEPATANGKPVAATFTITMKFKLDSK